MATTFEVRTFENGQPGQRATAELFEERQRALASATGCATACGKPHAVVAHSPYSRAVVDIVYARSAMG